MFVFGATSIGTTSIEAMVRERTRLVPPVFVCRSALGDALRIAWNSINLCLVSPNLVFKERHLSKDPSFVNCVSRRTCFAQLRGVDLVVLLGKCRLFLWWETGYLAPNAECEPWWAFPPLTRFDNNSPESKTHTWKSSSSSRGVKCRTTNPEMNHPRRPNTLTVHTAMMNSYLPKLVSKVILKGCHGNVQGTSRDTTDGWKLFISTICCYGL